MSEPSVGDDFCWSEPLVALEGALAGVGACVCCCCSCFGGRVIPALAARCCSCKARRSALLSLAFFGGTTILAGTFLVGGAAAGDDASVDIVAIPTSQVSGWLDRTCTLYTILRTSVLLYTAKLMK